MQYVDVLIDNEKLELTDLEQLPITFSFQIEDLENFQNKKGDTSYDITVPATTKNDRIFNTFHNPSIEDLTAGQIFRNTRLCTIIANGIELLSGKCFLTAASHSDVPLSYRFNAYGGNADWFITLKETTLYDVLIAVQFPFSKSAIVASWAYDGSDENLPYVFAPAKYAAWTDPLDLFIDLANPLNNRTGSDNNFDVTAMKPSISVYWTLYKAFKQIGYQIRSDFFNTRLFRGLVMPWTWGNFLSSEGTKYDLHKFRAATITAFYNHGTMGRQFINVDVSNDSKTGMFDNNNTVINGDYIWTAGNLEGKWTYNAPNYGPLQAAFSCILNLDISAWSNSNSHVWVHWFVNGVQVFVDPASNVQAPYVSASASTDTGQYTSTYSVLVNQGDTVSIKISADAFKSKLGSVTQNISVAQFQIDYFRIPVGGTIAFNSYNGLKKDKVLDMLKGIVETFNLSFVTDPVNKIVYFETTHDSKWSDGFYNKNTTDWSAKQDLSKQSDLNLFSDYERELLFKFKDDSNDGLAKLIQDRNSNVLAQGKYVFPNRFKTGNKTFENTFFSPVMHYEADQFQKITGISPQLVAIVPENISNTSHSEAQNTFAPKLCYYKGNVSGVGGWKFDGQELTTFPFMFAVNYKIGGHLDPILSYSDEKIGTISGSEVLGLGLIKVFFWQRLAIMRNGDFYDTNILLRTEDLQDPQHMREHKIIRSEKWECVTIDTFKPLVPESTKVSLRKFAPVTVDDFNATFPSYKSVITNVLGASQFDLKYSQLKCLSSDIPQPE